MKILRKIESEDELQEGARYLAFNNERKPFILWGIRILGSVELTYFRESLTARGMSFVGFKEVYAIEDSPEGCAQSSSECATERLWFFL